jgi:hypothetical protein
MTMSRHLAAVLLAAFVGFTGRAGAVIGTLDDVPAATLLLPYFEVDPSNVNGITTLLTIRNAASDPVVAHLTFWSNLSVPTLDFDVYLTGYDEQTLNLRDVLISGILPTTGPSDALSPRGSRSGPHNTFGGSCSTTIGSAPAYSNPALPASIRAHAQAWLTGHASALFGTCASTLTDHLVGYVTIDAVNRCNLFFPTDVGYFASGGLGVASNRNVLWGDWSLIDSSTNSAQAGNLVHIEASADDPLTSTPGNPTFYGRYTGGSAADNREPLMGLWNAPLDPLAGVGATTELLVWRDSGQAISPFSCNSGPPPVFPLGANTISVLSQDGAAVSLPSTSFPYETQRIPIVQPGSSLRLDLNTTAHVTAIRRSPGPVIPTGTLSTAMAAIQGVDSGKIGTADAAPAASLLLPYFEADLIDPNGARTALAIHNVLGSPVLARVVLWTDLSVPTLGFDVYLPGRGSRVVDLRDLFLTGSLPASGPSPLPGCAGVLPPAPLPAATLAGLNAAHLGAPSQLFGGLCAGANHNDGVVRGYVTVDLTTRCTSALPGQPGYFGAGGAVGFDNLLWGDWALVEPGTNRAHGGALVHLQASTTDPLTAAPGRPTFYGRYVAWTAADHREALPRAWGAPVRRSGVLAGGAGLLVWRDSGQVVQPFACGTLPAAFPLGQGPLLHLDETGQDVPVPPLAFSLEAQRRSVDWIGPDFGSLSLELGTRTGIFSLPFLQSHVTGLSGSPGLYSMSVPAVQLPPLVLHMDGFENGDFVLWSSKAP